MIATPSDDKNASRLIRRLSGPQAYPHAVDEVRVVETHISWVLLTGRFAYKIKKPVDLAFLDFSSLERRRRYCEEELRINRRTAPEYYLEVVPIGEAAGGPVIGQEPAVEYAVKMRQFPYSARLDRCLGEGHLKRCDLIRLGETIARFHESSPIRREIDPAAEVDRALRPVRNNFVHLDPAILSDEMRQRLGVIEGWTMQQCARLKNSLEDRAGKGAVRECHGDLHLENLLFLDGRFVPFDAIEFNANLRWIDSASDIAFLTMDLMARGHPGFAYDVLSAWLEANGDYDSLEVMRFYLVYRSLVRAVVMAIRNRGVGSRSSDQSVRPDLARYIGLAADLVDTPSPRLYLMNGFSGSGKTWLSERLVAPLGALRIRSDLERKRLAARPAGRSAGQRETGAIGEGLYGPEVTGRTYDVLARACETGLREGFDMIADAAFLARAQRRRFVDLAASLGAACTIVSCRGSQDQLHERLRLRAKRQADASDADVSVLNHQIRTHDPLDDAECRLMLEVDTEVDSLQEIVARLRKLQP